MTKQQLILINYAERVATGRMFLAIGAALMSGDDHTKLLIRYRQIKQAQELFNYESVKPAADLKILRRAVRFIREKLDEFLRIDKIEIGAYIIVVAGKLINIIDLTVGPTQPCMDNSSKRRELKYTQPNSAGYIEVDGLYMYKAVVTRDVTVGSITSPAGDEGRLILVQDDLGGHKSTLAPGNKGDAIVLNTLPRAITSLQWYKDDTGVYWTSKIMNPGIKPTSKPVFQLNDYLNTLDIFHELGYTQIELSTDGGPWLQFTGPFSFGAVDRPKGYWRARVKGLEPTRLVSAISYSNPVNAAQIGFEYDVDNIILS
jgi:hypothetical protein